MSVPKDRHRLQAVHSPWSETFLNSMQKSTQKNILGEEIGFVIQLLDLLQHMIEDLVVLMVMSQLLLNWFPKYFRISSIFLSL